MGDKAKANVQRCPLCIPTQRAVNYAEQARRHRQAGVNGERKLYPRDPFPSLPSSPAIWATGYLGVPAEETALPQHAQLLLPSPVFGSVVCSRERPSRAPRSPDRTAASSWDAGCRVAVELHRGAPRTCKSPMMFILQSAKHFAEGSFIPADKVAFIQKISFSHLHIPQTVWRGLQEPHPQPPAPLSLALALPAGSGGAGSVPTAPCADHSREGHGASGHRVPKPCAQTVCSNRVLKPCAQSRHSSPPCDSLRLEKNTVHPRYIPSRLPVQSKENQYTPSAPPPPPTHTHTNPGSSVHAQEEGRCSRMEKCSSFFPAAFPYSWSNSWIVISLCLSRAGLSSCLV